MWLVCVMAVQWLSSRTDVSAILYDIVVGQLLNDNFKIYIIFKILEYNCSYIYTHVKGLHIYTKTKPNLYKPLFCLSLSQYSQLYVLHIWQKHVFAMPEMCESLCVLMCFLCSLRILMCDHVSNSNQSLCRMSLLSLKLFGHLSWPLDMPRVSVCVGLALSLWQRGCWNINRRLFSLIHTSSSILMANATDLRALETDMKLGQDQWAQIVSQCQRWKCSVRI